MGYSQVLSLELSIPLSVLTGLGDLGAVQWACTRNFRWDSATVLGTVDHCQELSLELWVVPCLHRRRCSPASTHWSYGEGMHSRLVPGTLAGAEQFVRDLGASMVALLSRWAPASTTNWNYGEREHSGPKPGTFSGSMGVVR